MRLFLLPLLFFSWCAATQLNIESLIELHNAGAPTLRGVGREFIISASLFRDQDNEDLKLIKDEIKIAAERSVFLKVPTTAPLCYELQTTHDEAKKEQLVQHLKKNVLQQITFIRNQDFIVEEKIEAEPNAPTTKKE